MVPTSWFNQAFGRILELVPLAESVVKLNAVCMQCFKEAAYTKRLGQERKPLSLSTVEGVETVEVIGGSDMYHAVCRACYGGLTAGKENSVPVREETALHNVPGKQVTSATPRVLFATLQI
ncbi:hypothetical protein JZ751_027553 [Albula glossodonta]|uniref:Thymidine kinase n=1 Tax=Albula glossodonta TaxID=121402 RepID=A0A8T2NF12_9TELE|nr:hypothetical protein JZ751_027553 [Albula glossodonta]